MKTLSVLGSTGSIGKNVLKIVEQFPDRFKVCGLAAKGNVDLLASQIRRFQPECVSVFDAQTAQNLQRVLPGHNASVSILTGDQGYETVATLDRADVVVSAMVGAAGLMPTLAAIEAGKTVALANKETLVVAGEIVMNRAREKGVEILPVDSEHSAIFQCLSGQRRQDLAYILLTASGGPFLNLPRGHFPRLQPKDALNHPTWEMGAKITIDSATLMNKGLEVIEAKHLFGLSTEQIRVVIHPQSIVHSMAAFRDGAVMAQMGAPDMRGAIAYALSYPERLPLELPIPDFSDLGSLIFREPDMDKFPCLALAFDACRIGGTLPAVLNAANEVAVHAFLENGLGFDQIASVIRKTMEKHRVDSHPSLDDIRSADIWAREETRTIIQSLAQ